MLNLKGVEIFKFDISLATKQSCLEKSSWNHNNDCFISKNYKIEVILNLY